MPKVEFLKPVDQAVGKRRLLADLRGDLLSGRYAEFDLAVAYAKSGPLLRLKADIEKWRDAGGVARAIFGIDQQGTSQEALELALKLFNEVYIAQEGGITFHPKIYNFIGEKCARVYIGSHNLTVGGAERNFEGGVALTYALPAEEEALADARDVWLQLHPSLCPSTVQLDEAALAQLIADGRVVAEKAMTHGGGKGGPPKAKTRLILAPPSAIPAGLLPKLQKNAAQPDYPVGITGFAIQIKPHDTAYDELPTPVVASLRAILAANRSESVGFRRDNMAALLWRYFKDMKATLAQVERLLRPGGMAFFVVGDSKTKAGSEWASIETCRHTREIAEMVGFNVQPSIAIDVTTERLVHMKNAITVNEILIFQKPG